eukprot:11849218-Prorocentrum_lima.AAC.1
MSCHHDAHEYPITQDAEPKPPRTPAPPNTSSSVAGQEETYASHAEHEDDRAESHPGTLWPDSP